MCALHFYEHTKPGTFLKIVFTWRCHLEIWFPRLKNNSLNLFLVLCLHCCKFFSSCGKWRLLSSCGEGLLSVVVSLVVEHRL